MPTSAPGNSLRAGTPARGFTLIEVMVVVAIIAIGASVVSLALRDPALDRLERDGARLAALLEMARAEARAGAAPVRWVPVQEGSTTHFRFIGLPTASQLPTRWLDERVQAQIVGATSITLGPDAILPAQRIVLSLDAQRLELGSDGLSSFAVVNGGATAQR